MTDKVRKNIYIDKSLWNELERLARAKSLDEHSTVSTSELIRRSIQEYLNNAPRKIVFGQALSLSGRFAINTKNLEQPATALWLQEVNGKGGIRVKRYGKRLPVELIRYDDKSDKDTMVKLLTKLIKEDKVDFLLPPHGSDLHFAACPLANKHGYPLITWTVASPKLYGMAPALPYIFHLNPSIEARFRSLKDLFAELGVKSVALIYIHGLMGIEISEYLAQALGEVGVKVLIFQGYPYDANDLSLLLEQIKSAKVHALVAISYPPDTLLITEKAMAIGLNPKLFFVDIGGAMPMYRDKFGASKLEGVMSQGGWNPRISHEAQQYFDKFQETTGMEPDYYSGPIGYAAYQIYEQAIEKAGTLDRDKVREVMATETFDTVNGPIKFKGQINYKLPSDIGQWQKGVFESIAPKETRTAQPVYPKPKWPRQKSNRSPARP